MIVNSGRWRILSALLGTFALVGVLCTSAFAEDYTTNTVAGTVVSTTGANIAGAEVTLVSDKGVRRTATSNADGSFRLAQLEIGTYSATVSAAGYESLSGLAINNQLGAGAEFTVTMIEAGVLEEIVTTGVRQASHDFESNTSGISVDMAEMQLKYPVPRSLTDVALFAPGTHLGEQDFNTRSNGSLASFSGGSVAENAYYINGMNTTNFRNFTGASTVPFEFYEQVEVKTGGYQAEYGRSMGGFVNAVSKSGSNDYHFEVTGYWTPESGRQERPDADLAWNSLDYDKNTQLILQASGPIIKDRVFLYALYNDRDQYEEDYTSSRYTETVDASPFYAAKLDIIPFEGHRLEYTYFSDERNIRNEVFQYNDAGEDREDVDGSEIGVSNGEGVTQAGGENHIFKYTARFNDNFSISALYGESDFQRTAQSSADAEPLMFERYNQTSSAAIGGWVNSTIGLGADHREATRIDADFYFSAAGDHHIRLGWDQEDLTSEDFTTYSGGLYWRYNQCRDVAGCFGGTVALGEEWVRNLIYIAGGAFETKQSAIYIQDSWEISDRLTVNIGLRQENFENLNSLGETFIDTDDEIAPRLGMTYDLRGDGRTLLSAFYGRYYMPIASNTNIRLSGAEFFTEGFYRHDGFANRNSDDTPNGVDLSDPIQYQISADGEVPDVRVIKAEQVDPLFSDEYVLGIEHAFDNDWVLGARYTFRELTTQIDDIGINHAIVAWALENGYGLDDLQSSGFVWEIMDPSAHSIEYVLANPGEDIRVSTDLLDPLDGSTGLVTMDLTAEMLEYPSPKREYTSIEITGSKETEKWGIEASYVWSSNEGNTEGGVKSDNGQDDAGLTQDFDLVALGLNAAGSLPTEVEHQLKAAGYWVFNDQFRMGATARIRAPRKFGCFGVLPNNTYGDINGDISTDINALRQTYESQYDDDYWFCGGEATPRGSKLESDWIYEMGLSATYTPTLDNLPGALTFRMDIFNLFNDDGVTDIFENGEGPGGVAIDNYGTPSGYNSPRKIRISANWRF